MRRLTAILSLLTLAAALCAAPAHAERRLAFVMGIKSYPNFFIVDRAGNKIPTAQLITPLNDVDAMAATLTSLQFDVTTAKEVTRKGFLTAFEGFKNKIKPGDTALFFFAGHGIALQGGNFLLPNDTDPPTPNGEQLLREWAISEVSIIAGMQSRGAGLIITVLDACRNNPLLAVKNEQALADGRPLSAVTRALPSTLSRGLTAPQIPTDVVAIYSAGFGQTAIDILPNDPPEQKNSVFVRVFAAKIKQPGISLSELMPDVQTEVRDLAATAIEPDGPHLQTPAYLSQAVGHIYLAGPPAKQAEVRPPPAIDEQMWSAVKNTKVPEVLGEFCRLFPNSAHCAEARARIDEIKKQQALAEPRPAPPEAAPAAREKPPRPPSAPKEVAIVPTPAPARAQNVQCDAIKLDRLSARPHAFEDIECTCFKVNCPTAPQVSAAKPANPGAPSPSARLVRTYEGRDVNGSDFKVLPDRNFAQCIGACKAESKCSSFSFDKWNRYCFLKDVVPTEIRLEPKAIVAVMSRAEPLVSSAPVSVEKYRNTLFNDTPFRQLSNSTYESCERACRDEGRCEVFSFMKSAGQCKLIEHPTEYMRNAGVDADSGVKRQIPPTTGGGDAPPPAAAAPAPVAVGGPLVPVGAAMQLSIWSHNGSLMSLNSDGISRQFKYYQPRDGLEKAGITKGTLLFAGEKTGNSYTGVAYTFTARCGRFSFNVSGPISDDSTSVTMTGEKPKIDLQTCTVIGHEPETLVFDFKYKQ